MADLLVPNLGSSVTVSRWLRSAGESVDAGEPLVVIVGANVEVVLPAPKAGTLPDALPEEGSELDSGATLAVLINGSAPAAAAAPAPAASVRATPAARAIAAVEGVDLAALQGSGPGGRIMRGDVLGQLGDEDLRAPDGGFCIAEQLGGRLEQSEVRTMPAPAAPQPAPSAQQQSAPAPTGDVKRSELVPLTTMRRAIAEHMSRAKRTAPHQLAAIEVDLSAVAAVRSRLKERFAQRGVDLTYTACLAYAAVRVLRRHPILNATWHGEELIQSGAVHLGVAVAIEAGLVVPVVRNAEELNLQGLARAVNAVASGARAGTVTAEQMRGGSFTITNPGAGVIRWGQPVIPQPQTAILGVGAVQKRVAVVEDPTERLAIRPLTVLTLSLDGRAADISAADAFLADLKAELEAFAG